MTIIMTMRLHSQVPEKECKELCRNYETAESST